MLGAHKFNAAQSIGYNYCCQGRDGNSSHQNDHIHQHLFTRNSDVYYYRDIHIDKLCHIHKLQHPSGHHRSACYNDSYLRVCLREAYYSDSTRTYDPRYQHHRTWDISDNHNIYHRHSYNYYHGYHHRYLFYIQTQ